MKEFVGEWSSSYLETHSERFFRSYQIIKNYNHTFEKEILVDLASNNGIFLPALHAISPFKQIHIIDYGEKDSETLKIQSSQEVIKVNKHYLNLEKDYLPFKEESVDVVIFFEILEHLLYDPMHVLLEINRVLKKNGFLFISTPNLNSAGAFKRMLKGDNPNLFTPYRGLDKIYERHNREFTIGEVKLLANNAGLSVENVFTDPVKNFKMKFFLNLLNFLGISQIRNDELGTFMYVVCKKNRCIDLEKIDTDTRFPAPIYC